jgi:hypothetical protein
VHPHPYFSHKKKQQAAATAAEYSNSIGCTMKAAAPSCLLLLLQSAQLVMSSSSNNNNKWAAAGLSQTEFMQHDTVLVVDNNDCLTGETATKHNAHIFSKQQPHGVLHRAFSVFLFDASTKKLLLQQRASHKITFPNVRMLCDVCVCVCVYVLHYSKSFFYLYTHAF